MDSNELTKFIAGANERKTLYFEQPEVQEIQNKLKKLVGELKDQVKENTEEKDQLQAMWDQYDQKFAEHQNLEQMNRQLIVQVGAIESTGANSKSNVVGVLSQKASQCEQEAKNSEKAFLR